MGQVSNHDADSVGLSFEKHGFLGGCRGTMEISRWVVNDPARKENGRGRGGFAGVVRSLRHVRKKKGSIKPAVTCHASFFGL